MTEMFAAVGDALAHALLRAVSVTVESLPTPQRPSYLPPAPPMSRLAARASMDDLIRKGRQPAGRKP